MDVLSLDLSMSRCFEDIKFKYVDDNSPDVRKRKQDCKHTEMRKHRRRTNIDKHLHWYDCKCEIFRSTDLAEKPLSGEVAICVEEIGHLFWRQIRRVLCLRPGHLRDLAASVSTTPFQSS